MVDAPKGYSPCRGPRSRSARYSLPIQVERNHSVNLLGSLVVGSLLAGKGCDSLLRTARGLRHCCTASFIVILRELGCEATGSRDAVTVPSAGGLMALGGGLIIGTTSIALGGAWGLSPMPRNVGLRPRPWSSLMESPPVKHRVCATRQYVKGMLNKIPAPLHVT